VLTRIFFKEKPLNALVSLAEKDKVWYASMLAKKIDCTYPHMLKILDIFEKNGLVVTEGQGRIRIVRLTQKGEDLAADLQNALRRISRIEGSENKWK